MNLGLGIMLFLYGLVSLLLLLPVGLWVIAYRFVLYRMLEDGPLWQDLTKRQRFSDALQDALALLGVLALLLIQALALSLFCNWLWGQHVLTNNHVSHRISIDSGWAFLLTLPVAAWFAWYDIGTFLKMRSRVRSGPKVVRLYRDKQDHAA